MQKRINKDFLPWFLLVLLSLIWGSSFILIKKGLVVYSAGEVGALRIVSASLFLFPLAITRLKSLNRRQWVLLTVTGLLGSFLPAFLFAVAQTRLSSSVSGVLNTLTPLFVLIIGSLFFQQKIKLRASVGILFGIAGTVLLVLAGSDGKIGNINYYAFFVVLATLCYGINLNIIKHFFPALTAIEITSISFFIIGPVAAVYLFAATGFSHKLLYQDGGWPALGYILILGILGTAIALILFNKLVKLTTPIFTSFVTYLIPVVAVTWGLLDGEVLSAGHYAGMVIIIGGVYIANRKKTDTSP